MSPPPGAVASSPRYGSLFSGTSALDMGVQSVLGGHTVWHSDVKPAAIALLEQRHPGVPNLGDLTTMFPRDLKGGRTLPAAARVLECGPIDILTAGWPCQPWSGAGKQLGEADPRALWPYVARAIGALRPAVFVGENVARTATSGELRRVVGTLAALGYVGAWRCASASDVAGAAHKRDRLCVVAVDPLADPARIGRPEGWARAAGIVRGPHAPVGGGPVDGSAGGVSRLLPTPTQNMTTGAGSNGREGGLNLQTAAVRLLPTPAEGDSRNTRNSTANRSEGKSAHAGHTLCDVVHPASTIDWREFTPAIRRWEAILGRPAPAPTQPSFRAPHGPQVAPRFVEWLMGMPEGWVTDCSGLVARESGHRNACLSLLGDGVVPQWAAGSVSFLLEQVAERVGGGARLVA